MTKQPAPLAPPAQFPTSPEVLAEASAYSLSELAIMSPEEMSPEAELAYIEKLREQRERYQKALGVARSAPKKASSKASPGAASAAVLDVDLSGEEVEF